MESTHAEIYKIWMNHVKFNGWEIEDKDNENKSNNKERRVYIDEIKFLQEGGKSNKCQRQKSE